MVNNNIPRVSALEFATSFGMDNSLIKKSYLVSLILITMMFFIVFPEKAMMIIGPIDDGGGIAPPPPPPRRPEQPPQSTVRVKVNAPIIPDPTPFEPEVASGYVYDDPDAEHDAMFEGDFLFPPVERYEGGAVRIAKTECSEKVLPFYPELARKAGIQGVVIVNIIIGVDGSIMDAKVVSSPGRQFGFDDAALNAVRQWKCDPTTINGRKVETEVVVTVNFKMNR